MCTVIKMLMGTLAEEILGSARDLWNRHYCPPENRIMFSGIQIREGRSNMTFCWEKILLSQQVVILSQYD